MKKFITTIVVVFTFGAYALLQRFSSDDDVHVVAPAGLSNGKESSATTTLDVNPGTAAQTKTPAVRKSGLYADGTYTGTVEDAFYGYVQVRATVSNGKISDVTFLEYPNDRRESLQINSQATPWLSEEAIQAQSASVDIISGATDTSHAFIRSLSAALTKAKA